MPPTKHSIRKFGIAGTAFASASPLPHIYVQQTILSMRENMCRLAGLLFVRTYTFAAVR